LACSIHQKIFPDTLIHCLLTRQDLRSLTLPSQIPIILQTISMPKLSVLPSEQKFTFPPKPLNHVKIFECTPNLVCLSGLGGNSGTQTSRLQSCNGQLDRRRMAKTINSRENRLDIYLCVLDRSSRSNPKTHCSHQAAVVPCRSSGYQATSWEHFLVLSCLKPFISVTVGLQLNSLRWPIRGTCSKGRRTQTNTSKSDFITKKISLRWNFKSTKGFPEIAQDF